VEAKIRPLLMFQGTAEQAMNFYVSLFPGGTLTSFLAVVRVRWECSEMDFGFGSEAGHRVFLNRRSQVRVLPGPP
jgi:hypothetical protein